MASAPALNGPAHKSFSPVGWVQPTAPGSTALLGARTRAAAAAALPMLNQWWRAEVLNTFSNATLVALLK